MQPLQWEYRPDGLRAPALICAFKGWNDAADAASTAITFVGGALGARRFATIDPEDFYDFQATRPRIKLVEGQTRQIVWPEVELYEARVPRAPRDLILLAGSEPSFRWRGFSKLIVDVAEAIGVQLVVTLGALLADVPHTRAVSVTGLASDPALVARLGLATSSYEGPTGIVGILHAACQEAGLPSASLWAAVPHYIAAAPNPKAALALVRKLEGLVGVAVNAADLESAAADYDRQVNLAVQSDPDVQAFVERLEQAASEDPEAEPGPLPSGETIARDLQRFLRQAGEDEPPGSGLGAAALVDAMRMWFRRNHIARRRSALGGRADQPVVADRAGRKRRRRLEALGQDPLGDLDRDRSDPLRPVAVVGRHRHLLIVEQVVVGLLRGVEAPRLASAHGVQRELHVVGQLRGALRTPGLVIDQLVAAPPGRRSTRSTLPRSRCGPSLNVNCRSNHTGSDSESWERS